MIGPLASLIVKTASGPKKPAKSATTFVSNKGDSPSPAMSAKKPTVKKNCCFFRKTSESQTVREETTTIIKRKE